MTTSPPVRAARSLTIAGWLTVVAGATFVGVGIASLAQGHGMFSAGVGVMLICYGVGLAALGFFAARGHQLLSGLVIGAAVLHSLSLIEIARHDAAWVWLTLPLFLATVALGLHARVISHRSADRA